MLQQPAPWLPAPAHLELPDDQVHVWRARLDLLDSQSEEFRDSLSVDEQQRAARFHFEKDRRHFIAARGFLRRILGQYLRANPAELRFTYNQFGKPALLDAPH